MSFGFPAYSTDSQRFTLRQQELTAVVRESLDRLGWRYETPSPNRFIARNSVNPWSWGEKIAVEVSHDGVVTAKSACLMVTQCFDWGKNRRNVQAFFDEASRGASAREESRPPVASYDEQSLTPVERVIRDEERDKR